MQYKLKEHVHSSTYKGKQLGFVYVTCDQINYSSSGFFQIDLSKYQ